MATARKRGLGRGLDALLKKSPDEVSPPKPPAGEAAPHELPITALQPNALQPRQTFADEELEELAESIRAQGVIQPIVVSPQGGDMYSIVAGERRWRAAQRAGLKAVPVTIRKVDSDGELLQLALVENLQREDLNVLEEAEAYAQLRERFGLSQADIGARVGKSRTAVTNTLRLLRLPQSILELLRSGALTAGQARPLVGVTPASRQEELAQLAVEKGLSARELERLAREEAAPSKRRKPATADVHARAAAERLTRVLQTKVEIARRGPRGSIRIHFHSEDELMRLFDHIVQKETP